MGIEERTPLHLASVDCYLFLHWLLHRSPFELLKKAPWEILYLYISLNFSLIIYIKFVMYVHYRYWRSVCCIIVNAKVSFPYAFWLLLCVSVYLLNFSRFYSQTLSRNEKATLFLKNFFYKRPCDLLSKIQLNIRRHRFPSRKFEGANQNAAWTIHENEKYLSNWPTFSKPRLD